MNTIEQDALLTVKDVCRLLRCCDKTVYGLVRDKKLSSVRWADSTLRFKRADVLAFVEASRIAKETTPIRPDRQTQCVKNFLPKVPTIVEQSNVETL